MEITQTQNAPASAAAESGASSASLITSDFETFLTMLTTQMENQDPLNPMESTELASQLAQFSAVEQQVQTNALLTDMLATFASQDIADLSGWIGMEARTQMPVAFEGNPITVSGVPENGADRMQLWVRNSENEIVQRLDIPLEDTRFEWEGLKADDTPFADGTYSLSIVNFDGEDQLSQTPAMIYGEVEEAFLDGDDVWLTLRDGGQVRANDILALRRPEP